MNQTQLPPSRASCYYQESKSRTLAAMSSKPGTDGNAIPGPRDAAANETTKTTTNNHVKVLTRTRQEGAQQ